MTKVITYGTFDLLHYGHIRLLERAKVLGDYLIVGVTADDFDKQRGKINVQQSLMERLEAVRATGIADEIIIEEYEGQKIDDIKRYGIDIFTVGSDWVGKFDYLNEYCKVIYLERTQGVSSSDIRAQRHEIRLGLVGESGVLSKIDKECRFVNGLSVTAVYAEHYYFLPQALQKLCRWEQSYPEFLDGVEAVYIDENRVNSLTDGKASVALKDYAGKDKSVSVYAVDYAGNRSETVKFDNPYYTEPKPEPKATAPTKQAQSQSAGNTVQNQSTEKPAQTKPSGSSGSPANTTAGNNGNTSAENAGSADTGGSQEENTSSIPEGAFTPDGSASVLDEAQETADDKQFYTITTEAGNVFYLIIDGKRDS